MDTIQTETKPTRPTAFELLFGPMLLVSMVVSGYMYWQHEKTEGERQTESWLHDATAQKDAWKRYNQLIDGVAEHRFSDEQRSRLIEQKNNALEQALVARTAEAFDLVETQGLSSAELLDKYPRDPVRRQLQLEALTLLWPDVRSHTPAVRMNLVRMANRCHLHEAAPPLTRQAVIDCLRYGARSLGAQQDLTKLMDSAVVGEALAEAAQ